MQETNIRIMGLGGAGCRILDEVVTYIRNLSTVVAVNTDARALAECRAPAKLQIGEPHTRGFGTGGNVDLGRDAAGDDLELIRGMFADVDLLFLVVGLGGGTGTGGAPVILEAAREEGVTVMCFATLPFRFEGPDRMRQAEQVVDDLRRLSDALIIVPNERLAAVAGSENLEEIFGQVNAFIGSGVCGLEKLISQPGLINLDFADLQRVVKNSGGRCTVGYGEGRGKDKALQAVESLVGSPLLDGGKVLEKAGVLLVSIIGGEDLGLKEVGAITDAISARVGTDCRVFLGTVVDDKWLNRISLTAIVADDWKSDAGPEPEPDGEGDAAARPSTRGRPMQPDLKLEIKGKGRFKDVEPTIMDGQDLDVPTYVRRNVQITR